MNKKVIQKIQFNSILIIKLKKIITYKFHSDPILQISLQQKALSLLICKKIITQSQMESSSSSELETALKQLLSQIEQNEIQQSQIEQLRSKVKNLYSITTEKKKISLRSNNHQIN